jgi:hypothetical protein
MSVASLSELLAAITRVMWSRTNLASNECLTWHRNEDKSIRLVINIPAGRVVDDVRRFHGPPSSMGRTT